MSSPHQGSATPQAEAPAPARRVEEAPADPLHAFRLATKREKLKRRKAEAAAYRPGAGQLKPRHRRQDADKPKLKPKTLGVALESGTRGRRRRRY